MEYTRKDMENVWFNIKQMAELFECDEKTIEQHIQDALSEELYDTEVCEAGNYNLDVVFSVSYRVKSKEVAESRPEEKEMMVRVIMNCME